MLREREPQVGAQFRGMPAADLASQHPLIVLSRVAGPALTEILFSYPSGSLRSNARIRVADHLEIFHWLAAML
jgi:hypothetical protein